MYTVFSALHECYCDMAHALLIALETQDLSRMYLAHHQLEKTFNINIIIIIVNCLGV